MADSKVATLSIPLWGVLLLVATLSTSLGVNVRGELANYRMKNLTTRISNYESSFKEIRGQVADQNAVDSIVLTKLDNLAEKVDDLAEDFKAGRE